MDSAHNNQPVLVVAGVARQNGRVLLAQRRHDDSLGGLWEFPGGKVETGETPSQALVREFYEEFGATIRVGAWLGSQVHDYPHKSIELCAYEVELLSPLRRLEAHERVAWVAPEDLIKYELAPADEFLRTILLNRAEKL